VPKSIPALEVEECRGSTRERGKGTSEQVVLGFSFSNASLDFLVLIY